MAVERRNKKNGNGFVEVALGIVFQHGFYASAVYPFHQTVSGKYDKTPCYHLNYCGSGEKPVKQEY